MERGGAVRSDLVAARHVTDARRQRQRRRLRGPRPGSGLPRRGRPVSPGRRCLPPDRDRDRTPGDPRRGGARPADPGCPKDLDKPVTRSRDGTYDRRPGQGALQRIAALRTDPPLVDSESLPRANRLFHATHRFALVDAEVGERQERRCRRRQARRGRSAPHPAARPPLREPRARSRPRARAADPSQ